jgi:2-polyprenyl-6-methoxyphenol hydroxylase-like FAD-dependent oxidoreductase
MCGGVLGIVIALALQRQGFRVAVVEKRLVEGRTQEWNSSRHECQVSFQVAQPLVGVWVLWQQTCCWLNAVQLQWQGFRAAAAGLQGGGGGTAVGGGRTQE